MESYMREVVPGDLVPLSKLEEFSDWSALKKVRYQLDTLTTSDRHERTVLQTPRGWGEA